ncbi:TlpA family protein disulfide reductase [Kaarinaea lacus]
MSKLIRTLGILTVLLFSLTVSAAEKFDDFQGNQKSITDFAGNGKWLVVMLWASDCHVCNQEVHQYIKFHQEHVSKDAQVLGISLDGAAKKNDAKDFLKRHKVTFPSLIGEPETVASMYQELTGDTWVGTPSFMVYTPQGKLQGAQAGAVPVPVIESFIERESAVAQPQS